MSFLPPTGLSISLRYLICILYDESFSPTRLYDDGDLPVSSSQQTLKLPFNEPLPVFDTTTARLAAALPVRVLAVFHVLGPFFLVWYTQRTSPYWP